MSQKCRRQQTAPRDMQALRRVLRNYVQVFDDPPYLLLEDQRRVERAVRRKLLQLGVGNRAPDEVRQPRRQIDVGDAVVLSRPDPRR